MATKKRTKSTRRLKPGKALEKKQPLLTVRLEGTYITGIQMGSGGGQTPPPPPPNK